MCCTPHLTLFAGLSQEYFIYEEARMKRQVEYSLIPIGAIVLALCIGMMRQVCLEKKQSNIEIEVPVESKVDFTQNVTNNDEDSSPTKLNQNTPRATKEEEIVPPKQVHLPKITEMIVGCRHASIFAKVSSKLLIANIWFLCFSLSSLFVEKTQSITVIAVATYLITVVDEVLLRCAAQ